MSADALFATVPAAMLRHRLALGVAWIDAISRNGAAGALSTILERIGAFPLRLAFDRHRGDRFALRYAARVRQRIDRAVADGLDTDVRVHVHAPAQGGRLDYDPLQDARTYVPRRLQLALALEDGAPALTPANIRAPWLWPGATYAFPATATLVRGSVRRGAALATSAPVPWARVFVTTPAAETDFALATLVGCAHGDDRGEFVLAVGANAVSGAALVNPVNVRLWAFVAPAGAVDPADSLLGLPLENAGAALDGAILRGTAVPPAYTKQQSATLALRLGATYGRPDATFLFDP